MKRGKFSPREGAKFLKPILTITLVLFSILLSACPPLEEDPLESTITAPAGPLDTGKWLGILQQIHDRGMLVTLDLSACTVSNDEIFRRAHQDGTPYSDNGNPYDDYNQFNPLSGFSLGKKFITSIILPDDATMICNATNDIDLENLPGVDKNKSAFMEFTNLRSVSGKNVRLIGNLAFMERTSLETVDFPRAVHILSFAFYGCTGLKEVRIEYARDILPGAFENCTNLEKVDLPYVGTISQYAFRNCSSLTEVSFPYATVIGGEAFKNCTSLKTARFHANPAHTPPTDHPLKPWFDKNGSWDPPIDDKKVNVALPCSNDSVIFHPYAFRGCKSLETLDVRNAWNVFFFEGALADIGTHLDLHLFDDNGTKSFGHPQTFAYLGGVENGIHHGDVTLRSITIIAPVVSPPDDSQIVKYYDDVRTGIFHDIRGRYGYYFEDTKDNDGNVTSYRVTVRRVPAL